MLVKYLSEWHIPTKVSCRVIDPSLVFTYQRDAIPRNEIQWIEDFGFQGLEDNPVRRIGLVIQFLLGFGHPCYWNCSSDGTEYSQTLIFEKTWIPGWAANPHCVKKARLQNSTPWRAVERRNKAYKETYVVSAHLFDNTVKEGPSRFASIELKTYTRFIQPELGDTKVVAWWSDSAREHFLSNRADCYHVAGFDWDSALLYSKRLGCDQYYIGSSLSCPQTAVASNQEIGASLRDFWHRHIRWYFNLDFCLPDSKLAYLYHQLARVELFYTDYQEFAADNTEFAVVFHYLDSNVHYTWNT